MPNTNFVPNWTFERTLPSPFDSYSGKSAVMKDIASKYCNQPKKRATLHSATLQAVFSCQLRNTRIPDQQKEHRPHR